jgi:hypothetical protein
MEYKKEYGELPQLFFTNVLQKPLQKVFHKSPPKTHHKGLIYYSFMTTLPKWDSKKEYGELPQLFSQMFSKNIIKKYFIKVPQKNHHKGLIYYPFMTTPIKWDSKMDYKKGLQRGL